MPQEQRAQQRCDVQSVGVRVREDADLVVAQLAHIRGARLDPERDADVVHFLGRADGGGFQLPGVQDLAAQRHDGLELLSRACLALPPAESPSTRNSSERRGS